MDPKLYDAHSLAQASLHTLAAKMLHAAATAAAEAAVQNGDSYVGLLVVGPATGVNDIASIKKDVLPAMRLVTALPIRLLFADLPSNDSRMLLAEAATLEDGENIWATAKVGFAAKRITESESLHFVMSLSTLHWMQQLPWGTDQAQLGGAISYVTLPPSPMAELRALADEELQGFFSSRMAELRPGGQMVATFDGETSDVSHQFSRTYFLAEKALKAMIEEELLPHDFMLHYFIPTVSYSEERCNAMLTECGLNAIEKTFLDIPCPYLLAWQANHDSVKHADEVANAFLACFKQQLLDAMAACKVPEGESLLQQLRSRMSKFVAEAPAQFHTGGITAFVHTAKPAAS